MKKKVARLNGDDKKLLQSISELTPGNLEIIKNMFNQGYGSKNIYVHLQDNIKREPQIIELYISFLIYSNFVKALEFLRDEINFDEIEMLKLANKYNPELLYLYLKVNKIDINALQEIVSENPKVYEMLLSSDLYSKEEKNVIFAKSYKWFADGEPIQYFELSKNIKFRGREDYLKLVNAYIYEDGSIKKFCRKYRLDRTNFKKILENFSKEDSELAEQITQVKERASQRFISFMKDSIDKVIKNEITIRELMQISGGRINGWDFLDTKDYIEPEKHLIVLLKMLEEIEKGNKDFKRDKLDKRYDLPEIGHTNMEELVTWFDNGKGEPIENVCEALGVIKGRLEYNDLREVKLEEAQRLKVLSIKFLSQAHKYGGDFSKSDEIQFVNHDCFFLDQETKENLYATDKNLDDARTIVKAKKKTSSRRLVKAVIKDILTGKIAESEIEEAYEKVKMDELQEKSLEEKREQSMSGLRTIDDYISFINNQKQEQKKEDLDDDEPNR